MHQARKPEAQSARDEGEKNLPPRVERSTLETLWVAFLPAVRKAWGDASASPVLVSVGFTIFP